MGRVKLTRNAVPHTAAMAPRSADPVNGPCAIFSNDSYFTAMIKSWGWRRTKR